MRIEHMLASQALRRADKPAFVTEREIITFGELHGRSQAIACGLHQAGVKAGDRMLVYLPNGIEFVELVCAAFTLGIVVVPANTRLTMKELAYFAEDCQPSLIVYHSDSAMALESIREDLPGSRHLVVGSAHTGTLSFAQLADMPACVLPEKDCDNDDAMIMYSSGTTGKPKGAIITHSNLVIQHTFLNASLWGLRSEEKMLVTTPISHRAGLARMMNSLCLGITVYLMERFDPEAALDLIEKQGITAIGIVPTIARLLMPCLEKRPSSCTTLRHVIATGEAFPIELRKKLIALLPHLQLHSFYAMTEVGGITSLSGEEQFTYPDSVGRLTPGVEARIVDDGANEVALDEVGELMVRCGAPGRFLTMRGYYNRPEDDASTIVNGWIKTGDMARMDGDGYLYIVDRKKDMVLSGGYNIYTKEVEQVLMEHPAIADVAVIGVPDLAFGEAVAAFVELKDGAILTEEDVVAFARERIAGYKKPKHVRFTLALPRNNLGKVLKAELRKQIATGAMQE